MPTRLRIDDHMHPLTKKQSDAIKPNPLPICPVALKEGGLLLADFKAAQAQLDAQDAVRLKLATN